MGLFAAATGKFESFAIDTKQKKTLCLTAYC
jgi:hypothetical protein